MLSEFSLKNISAIIFDLGGVVLNLDMELTIKAFGGYGLSPDSLEYHSGGPDGLFHHYEKGNIPSEKFLEVLSGHFPENASHSIIIECWNKMLLDLPAHRVEFLQKLKEKLPVFLLSNTNEIHVEAFEKSISLQYDKDFLERLFNRVYYSCRMGMRKPDVEIYEKVIRDNLLNPARTLFIDDNAENVAGAAKAGLQVYHLTSAQTIERLLIGLV